MRAFTYTTCFFIGLVVGYWIFFTPTFGLYPKYTEENCTPDRMALENARRSCTQAKLKSNGWDDAILCRDCTDKNTGFNKEDGTALYQDGWEECKVCKTRREEEESRLREICDKEYNELLFCE